MTITGPAQELVAAIAADPEYAWAWHCNIAVPIMDVTGVSHEVANQAAAHLMQHLFECDITRDPRFQYQKSDAQQYAEFRIAMDEAEDAEMSALNGEGSAPPPGFEPSPLAWAISRWNAEVANRPLKNIHRRSLDDAWRQVVRHFGGDDEALLGPRHDDLVAAELSARNGEFV